MEVAGVSALASWESFYVIVGSSAAALTGLMFVVITLAAERWSGQTEPAVAAFATPTVVHLCAALLVSASMSAPWRTIEAAGLAVGIAGAAGVAYTLIVTRRAHRQTNYRPVLEDWVWHALIPFVAYLSYAIAGLGAHARSLTSEFVIAAGTLLLLFCGIHNSWDSVTYNALNNPKVPGDPPSPPPAQGA
jgi:hypothetical protein